MEFTYFNVLVGLLILAFGTLAGFKLIPLILKKPLTENEVKIQTEVANYAKMIIKELEKQSGSEEELKKKAIDAICMEFPKVDKIIVTVIVGKVYELTKNSVE